MDGLDGRESPQPGRGPGAGGGKAPGRERLGAVLPDGAGPGGRPLGGGASGAACPKRAVSLAVLAPKDGWLCRVDTREAGRASVVLGAGRETRKAPWITGRAYAFAKVLGDPVRQGEPLGWVYASTEGRAQEGARLLAGALEIGERPPEKRPLFLCSDNGEGRPAAVNLCLHPLLEDL